MTLEIEMQGNWYTPQNGSVFLIEEVSKRQDFQVLGRKKKKNRKLRRGKNYLIVEENRWTREIQKQMIDLFSKNFNQLTEDEIEIFRLLSNDHQFFFGPHLHLQFQVKSLSIYLPLIFSHQDEGLYHFRLTYLWNDQFCLISIDLLVRSSYFLCSPIGSFCLRF